MMSMATTVLRAVEMFETTLVAVSVTTLCTPPTSFESRLWISPVRVPVKKRSDMLCK
jgi:hypothetical protein